MDIIDFPLTFGGIFFGVGILALLITFYSSWRRDRRREYDLRVMQMDAEEKRKQRELENSEMERYKKEKIEEEERINKSAGLGSGGFIILDLPEDKIPFFHDLLKGFEEYSKLKGYSVSFSVDSTFTNRIAFKFTLKDSIINIGTERVRRDFKEYLEKVQSSDSLDDMPVVTSFEEHDLLVTVLKNRINFLQHSYNLTKNITEYLQRLLWKSSSMPVSPAQNLIVQTGGVMDSKNYRAIASSGVIQGDNNEIKDVKIDTSIKIGNSFNEIKSQIEGLEKLIGILKHETMLNPDQRDSVIKDFEKVKDELLEEKYPDKSRIKKWLERAKNGLEIAKLSNELIEIVKIVFASFGLSWPS